MWCRHCQQDVPAVAAATRGDVQCARCRRPLTIASDAGIALDDSGAALRSAASLVESDAVLNEQARLQRAIRRARSAVAPAPTGPRTLRFDLPHDGSVAALAGPPTPAPTATIQATRPSRDRFAQFVAWTLAVAGAAALGAGLGMMLWCLLRGQEGAWQSGLWNAGLAATLGGQGLMIIGLVQMLASMWQTTRASANKLADLHRDLRRVERTADAISGDRNATAAGFFAALAADASPDTMLATLRAQVHVLSNRLERMR
ncbi:hypothetical protein Pla175_08150 [Pirellulimonas nuda]|uniref:Uncharacterized protein n=1 Tax=Pirellulimonas nuda TaxID=2528009 RepID=A0A518D7J6_9BACT|nr:hypothetical protein [Pirellulimonas nuda]QDU87453.1 hypothetical protein Pla175_08150 [Pirellulimonas nuda]